jgi:hypothetical protein
MTSRSSCTASFQFVVARDWPDEQSGLRNFTPLKLTVASLEQPNRIDRVPAQTLSALQDCARSTPPSSVAG